MRYIIFSIVFLLSMTMHAQFLTKKKGEIIFKNGDTISCYIRDFTWKRSPQVFRYKLDKKDKWIEAPINSMDVMTLGSGSSFVASLVDIDNSSDVVTSLGHDGDNPGMGNSGKDFKFEKVHLLLKKLVIGKANLYESNHKTIQKYFYSTKDTEGIKQLLYKRYIIKKDANEIRNHRIGKNNHYLRQISKNVSCEESINYKKLMPFEKKRLIKYFERYNKTCK